MADEASIPAAPASVPVSELKALLAKWEHDFIGRAHEIVQGVKSLIVDAEAAVEKVEEAV
jgi:hypothetical protein